MIRTHILVRAAIVAGAAGLIYGCTSDATVLSPPVVDPLFRSYVSIGNSIAAGVQSNGINDSTQKQSFAYMLAQSMGTRFAVPFLRSPGCTPPIANWQTGALVGGPSSTGTTCLLRDPAFVTEILNNVAVPSAASSEVDSPSSPFHNVLTTLFLGGKTQVQKAIDADPTFLTIEIGPNDVLQAGYIGVLAPLAGVSRGATDFNTFKTNYDKMLADLKAGSPHLQGGLLVGNFRMSALAILFPAAALANPAFAAGFSTAATGTPTGLTILPNCATAPGNQSLISFAIIPQIKLYLATNGTASGAHPPVLSCVKGQFPPSALVGEIFILDATEQATLDALVSQMNTYIQGKATELNFAYVDPTPILLAQKATGGCVNAVPNLAAAATTSPFGTCVSFDGLHPTQSGQRLLANAMIAAINTKYGTALPAQ